MNEEDLKKEIQKRHMDIVADFRSERYKILPLVSSILVGLLAISLEAGQGLIRNPTLFKISLALLIILIPISLFFFLRSFRYEEEDMLVKFKKIATEKTDDHMDDKSLMKKVTLSSPWIMTTLLFLGVVGIILSFFVKDL